MIVAGLKRNARERSAELAVREIDAGAVSRSFDWGELHATVTSLARRLERGPAAGAVLVCGGNRFETLAAILAGLHADRDVAPVAPETPASELRKLCAEAGAKLAVGPPEVLEMLDGHVVESIPRDDIVGMAQDPAGSPLGTGDGSILLRSSGTTGHPKIVRRIAAALDAVGESCRKVIGIDANDQLLLAIPVYHSYAIDLGLLTGVSAGAALELHARFDVAAVRSSLARRGVTCFPAVPLMLDSLARGVTGSLPAPSLRKVISAGSPLSAEVAARFRAVYGVSVGQVYGATEFGSVTYNDPDSWDEERGPFRPECVGRPFPGVQLRIVPQDDPSGSVAVGREGQVAVASPSMLSEYLGEDEIPMNEGFLLTGDLGRVDGSGSLELTGRLRLMIDVGGLKVNPLEVEAVLVRHPLVQDVIAVPIYFSETVSRLKAIVIPEPGAELTRDEIRSFAREHLIHYKVPRSFEITSEVPRSPTGKILRQKLMEAADGDR
jgi:long-chain acyl-CoA synthetase